MISRIYLICVLFMGNNTAFITGKINTYKSLSIPTECEPNKVYQKDDVTCFCNENGRWPHQNCSLVFDINLKTVCEPNSFVQVNCNVCRCSKTGNIDKEFCTNHICNADPANKIIHRRSSSIKNKCELNHWYVISSCRLCFCITRENLLCAPETHPKNLVIGKYNLTDCGPDWLSDINKLLSSVNPLRLGSKIHKNFDPSNTNSVDNPVVVPIQSTPNDEIEYKDNPKSIIFNRENYNDKKVKIARNDDKSDNDDKSLDSSIESNSENKVAEGKTIERTAGNTAMPFDNDEVNDSNNLNELDSDRRKTDNESGGSNGSKEDSEQVDATKEVESTLNTNKDEEDKELKRRDQKSEESLLKLSLPGMLSKVFNFALRKSMVSLNDVNCAPGSTLVLNCNTCFCLNNGKMLCTQKKCE